MKILLSNESLLVLNELIHDSNISGKAFWTIGIALIKVCCFFLSEASACGERSETQSENLTKNATIKFLDESFLEQPHTYTGERYLI